MLLVAYVYNYSVNHTGSAKILMKLFLEKGNRQRSLSQRTTDYVYEFIGLWFVVQKLIISYLSDFFWPIEGANWMEQMWSNC